MHDGILSRAARTCEKRERKESSVPVFSLFFLFFHSIFDCGKVLPGR